MSTYENQTGRLPPQSLLQQRYLIVGRAGKGGMGAVYQAIDTQGDNRRVAIKEMSQGQLSDIELYQATRQFQREATMLSRLSHPNLPRIYDAFNERGRSYLVMDFIDGKTLLQLLKESGYRPLPVPHVVEYARQLCDVLAYLHQQQPPVIFRDLKPTNVMVTPDGHVFLIDFGIARIFKEGQQQDTAFLGSPGYAPPEQHGTSQTNPRSDLYSLGATLHCCLTGRDPYHAEDRFAFPPVRQYNPQVPVELDQLIQRLVALDERQRPVSAFEVQQALIKINQQAAEDTRAISPAMASASAPTQYVSPAPALPPTQYVPPLNPNKAPLVPPTAPVTPARSPQALPQKGSNPSSFARAWTPSFILVFGVLLILTIAGSILALNTLVDSDHMVEFGLSVLLLLIAFIGAAVMHSAFSKIILLIMGLAALVSGLAFALQAVPAQLLENSSLPTSLTSLAGFVVLNRVFTGGLIVASIISLLWLARPFALVDRIIILILFGVVAGCAIYQYPLNDFAPEGITKHTLLLIALIMLIQSIVLVVQMERVRVRANRS